MLPAPNNQWTDKNALYPRKTPRQEALASELGSAQVALQYPVFASQQLLDLVVMSLFTFHYVSMPFPAFSFTFPWLSS